MLLVHMHIHASMTGKQHVCLGFSKEKGCRLGHHAIGHRPTNIYVWTFCTYAHMDTYVYMHLGYRSRPDLIRHHSDEQWHMWWGYLSRHVGGGALGLQLQQALRDDLGALLTSHQLLQRPQNLHKHFPPQGQADQPCLSLDARNPAPARYSCQTSAVPKAPSSCLRETPGVVAHRLFCPCSVACRG